MQQGRKSSSGQGLPHRAAEERATKRGSKRVRKGFQGRISLSPLFAFFAWAVLHSEGEREDRKPHNCHLQSH